MSQQQQPALSADAQAILTGIQNLIGTMNSNQGTSNSSFTKPDAYKGSSASDARRFLSQYESWAAEKTDLSADDQKKVKSCLLLCSGSAGAWASPFLACMGTGTPVWADWAAFVRAFKQQWVTVDEEAEALAALDGMKMGAKQPFPEFIQRFQEQVNL